MRRVALLFSLGGCQLVFPLREPGLTDAATDLQPGVCAGAEPVQVCPVTAPTTEYRIEQLEDLDTTTSTDCAPYSVVPPAEDPMACVIAATTIVITNGGVLRAHGTRPLILLATEAISIDGVLDVSSSIAGGPGAGATATDETQRCTLPVSLGISGGAGGTFEGQGGSGGDSGGTGGVAMAGFKPTKLHAGCPGSVGVPVGLGGAPGLGGGAVALVAPMISVSNTINASGSGGDGGGGGAGGGNGGGGGGGAGGMIVLVGSVTKTGAFKVFANGGGGGGGGGGASLGGAGAESLGPTQPGTGGLGPMGGRGGDGGVATSSDGGPGVNSGSGGGGGGGGHGFVKTITPR